MSRRRLAAAALAAAAAAGCGSAPAPAPAPAAASTSASAATFTNPVYADNFPDPAVLKADGSWYAYGTNGPGGTVPVLSSPDLVQWTARGDAMPQPGPWASAGNTWAPEVIAAGGGYRLYYTARATGPDKQCIGVARSDRPEGPFTDSGPAPLVCEAAEGGSIDASPFRDADGSLWLLWKNDGNCCDKPVHLYARRLTADGTAFTGPRATLLTNTKPWQGNLVEAPELVRRGSAYVLFYSANAFDSADYAVGYATCRSPAGPCVDAPEPVLRTNDAAAGPGHGFVVTDGAGGTWMLYHAWSPEGIGGTFPGRRLWLDRIDWTGDRPVVRGPTDEPQPVPAP